MILRTIHGALALGSAKVVMASVSSSSQAKRPATWTITGTPVSWTWSGASTGGPPWAAGGRPAPGPGDRRTGDRPGGRPLRLARRRHAGHHDLRRSQRQGAV